MTMRKEQHSMKNRLRLLVVGDKTRFIHLKQFIIELQMIVVANLEMLYNHIPIQNHGYGRGNLFHLQLGIIG